MIETSIFQPENYEAQLKLMRYHGVRNVYFIFQPHYEKIICSYNDLPLDELTFIQNLNARLVDNGHIDRDYKCLYFQYYFTPLVMYYRGAIDSNALGRFLDISMFAFRGSKDLNRYTNYFNLIGKAKGGLFYNPTTITGCVGNGSHWAFYYGYEVFWRDDRDNDRYIDRDKQTDFEMAIQEYDDVICFYQGLFWESVKTIVGVNVENIYKILTSESPRDRDYFNACRKYNNLIQKIDALIPLIEADFYQNFLKSLSYGKERRGIDTERIRIAERVGISYRWVVEREYGRYRSARNIKRIRENDRFR